MDENTYNEIKQKIPEIIKRQKEIYLDYKDFINTTIKPNELIIKDWFILILPTNDNYETLISNAYKNTEIIQDIIKQYDDILDSITNDEQVSENYLKLVFNTLNQSKIFQNLQTSLKSARDWYSQIQQDDINIQSKRVFVEILSDLLTRTENIEKTEYLQISHIFAFKYFSNPNKNFVIIGANGSGKSSFARNSKKVLDKNVAIIAAQKIFTLSKISSVSFGTSSRQDLWLYQTDDKLYKDISFVHQIGNDLQNVFKSLVEEQNAKANECFERNRHEVIEKRDKTVLETVITIWNEILEQRVLFYSPGQLSVIIPGSTVQYDFMELSDGEKAIFYYIAHVLLAKPDSFIIVDEPENHLNLALVTRLWDRLEFERKDCRFIYLTHNLDFAASRSNAEKLWMKEFIPPAQWNIETLPSDDNLPEILYMELLGSRKPILFCEGEKSSLDYQLYNRLFPQYTVIPVKGHVQVINYTKAFNNSTFVHGNKAIGIIDGDFHTEQQKNSWKNDSIYCIEVQEVENILCDEDLLQVCKDCFYSTDEKLQEAKNRLFTKLKQDIELQVLEYATQSVNEFFKANMIERCTTEEELKDKYSGLLQNSSSLIEKLIKERREILEDIIVRRDYSLGIRKYNNKGLIGIVPVIIEKDYKDKIFRLLDEHPELVSMLREKYFADVSECIIM